MTGNDLGTLEQLDSVSINSVLRQVKSAVLDDLLKEGIVVGKTNIKLTTSRTGQGGKRLWFRCPTCQKRVGRLYQIANRLVCRFCSQRYYQGQRFKEMIENCLK